jgi:hypothetical protein
LVDGRLQTVAADEQEIMGAAGSAMSTAHDLGLWMQLLLDGGSANGQELTLATTVQEMLAPTMVSPLSISEMAPIDAHSGFAYGLGWASYHYHGYEVIEKGGALDGIRTVVCLVPQLNVGVAVAANLNLTALPESIRGFVLEQLLGAADVDVQGEIEAAGAAIAAVFAAPLPQAANPVAPSVPLEAFAGVYENDLYEGIVVIAEGDTLRLEAGSIKKPATLTHFDYNTFLLDWGDVTLIPGQATFVVGPEGTATAVETEDLGRLERVADE